MKPRIKKVYAKNSAKRNFSKETIECVSSLAYLTENDAPEGLVQEDDVKLNHLLPQNKLIVLVGDIVWAKITGHNWWPSMVSYDPNLGVFSQNLKKAAKYHVQFFGDASLRGWVSKNNILKFSGLDEFLSLPKRLTALKLNKPSLKLSWDHAVIQAEKSLCLSRNQRRLKCTFIYNGTANRAHFLKKRKIVKIQAEPKQPSRSSERLLCKKTSSEDASELESDNKSIGKDLLQNLDSNHNTGATLEQNSILKELTVDQNWFGLCQDRNNSIDSGIEDFEEMEILEGKRKRKQKIFADFHTGKELHRAKVSNKNNGSSKMTKTEELAAPESEVCNHDASDKENYTRLKDAIDLIPDENNAQMLPSISETISETTENNASKSDDKIIEPENVVKKAEKTLSYAVDMSLLKTDSEKCSDLWNNLKKDIFCSICEGSESTLVSCVGGCFQSFHVDCLGIKTLPKSDFTCDTCIAGYHFCYVCKEGGNLIECTQTNCAKCYHLDCLKKIPSWNVDKKSLANFICPQHSCMYCLNNSPVNISSNPKKLLKCIRCPTAYHASSCLIAGSTVVTSNHMICDKHFESENHNSKHLGVNVSWCFVCSIGGSLVCCDTCPASFHIECIDDLESVPEKSWRCIDCREYNKPKYGDIIWVKYGIYRWWPARICVPEEIPEKIQNLPHVIGQFPVMFYGSRDYCWVHSGRVFKYQIGDKGNKNTKLNASLSKYFEHAIVEAQQAYNELEKMRAEQAELIDKKKSTKPPVYKKIKSNKPVSCIRNILELSEWPICECTEKEPCTSDASCLNRMLLFECSQKTCPSKDSCHNQRMQKNQYKSCKPFRCEGRGWGLKADAEIKCGEFVIEYIGELIDEETCHKRVKQYHEKNIKDYYFLTIDKDNIIDAYPKGNLSRFMNHSCNPNCETQKWTVNGEVRVGLFATRDIHIGDELCFNYNLDSLGNEKKQCRCGSSNCSGFLGVPPKTQHSMMVAEKAKIKKEKLKKKSVQKTVHEDDCFICGDGGELVLCSRNKCVKAYHIGCLKLTKLPQGKWECPWHYCDNCGKLAKILCALCTNSYCAKHSANEIVVMKDDIALCVDHDDEEFKVFCKSMEEADQSGGESSITKTSKVAPKNNQKTTAKKVLPAACEKEGKPAISEADSKTPISVDDCLNTKDLSCKIPKMRTKSKFPNGKPVKKRKIEQSKSKGVKKKKVTNKVK